VIIWKGPAATAWAGAILIITAEAIPAQAIHKEELHPPAATLLGNGTLAGIIDTHKLYPIEPGLYGVLSSRIGCYVIQTSITPVFKQPV
jgi:hypothetical protein